MNKYAPIFTAALALTFAGAQAQQGRQAAAAQQQPGAAAQGQPRQLAAVDLSSADFEFMLRAAESGHAEILAARLALARSQDAGVRQLAGRLLEDHQATNARLRQIARAHNVVMPPDPSRQQKYVIDGLQGLRGQAFERDFIERIGMEAHQEAIRLFQSQATAQGRDRELRDFALATLPMLRQHLAMAQSLHARAGQGAERSAADAGDGDRPAGQAEARELVREAVQVVQRMKTDPQLTTLLERAQGVFILPTYGRAALGLGVQGGKGVLVTRQGADFGNPVFYSMGGISVGLQAGGAAGELAFLLMTERAVQQFRSDRGFSLTADTGLAMGAYSAREHASTGKVQDVVVWSGTRGAYAGASFGVTDVAVDAAANRAYYGSADATPLQILGGRIENPHHNVLGRVLGA